MTTKMKNQSRRKKLLIISLVVISIITLGGGLIYFNANRTYTLGDKLEYIGKRDYGCAWFCDSRPSTTYSFATDMTPPELVQYFANAQTINKSIDIEHWQERSSPFLIHFRNSESGERFTVLFYRTVDELNHHFNLHPTTKMFAVEIESDEYQLAKDSLY
jgi:hypothetical protein